MSSESTKNRDKVEYFVALGERMKRIERESHDVVPDSHEIVAKTGIPLMARLDGHCFSTFTQGLRRPFDRRLAAAMRRTAADLLTEFNCATAYTQSDEITLIWMPQFDEKTGEPRPWQFNGRVHKLNSLLSSFCSVRFNFHIQQLFAGVVADVDIANVFDESSEYPDSYELPRDSDVGLPLGEVRYEQETLNRLRSAMAIFDSRLFCVENISLALDCLVWRQQHDCKRNSVHGLARALFTTNQLQKRSVPAMELMLVEKKVAYEHMDAQFRQGVFVKRRLVPIDAVDRKTGLSVVTMRSRLVFVYCAMPWGETASNETIASVCNWLAAKAIEAGAEVAPI